jgi:oligopeptide/dipeptide ABC transporter ATP-binding protein
MYLGRIVEKATAVELYRNPRHPYTAALLSAAPNPDPRPTKRRIVLAGEVPSPANPPTGCPFHPRCPLTRHAAANVGENDTVNIMSGGKAVRVLRKCVAETPVLKQTSEGEAGHLAACWVNQ